MEEAGTPPTFRAGFWEPTRISWDFNPGARSGGDGFTEAADRGPPACPRTPLPCVAGTARAGPRVCEGSAAPSLPTPRRGPCPENPRSPPSPPVSTRLREDGASGHGKLGGRRGLLCSRLLRALLGGGFVRSPSAGGRRPPPPAPFRCSLCEGGLWLRRTLRAEDTVRLLPPAPHRVAGWSGVRRTVVRRPGVLGLRPGLGLRNTPGNPAHLPPPTLNVLYKRNSCVLLKN